MRSYIVYFFRPFGILQSKKIFLFSFLCIIIHSFNLQAQIITTIAGNGSTFNTGDGGPATNAGIHFPCGIVIDNASNIYLTTLRNSIRKIDASGIITTIAGTGVGGFSGDGGQATDAQISATFDIAKDEMGNIYINDNGNYRIRKVDTSGIIFTIAGTGFPSNTGDGGPATNATINGQNIYSDILGNIYLADSGSIRKISVTTGIITRIAGTGIGGFSGDGGPATAAQILAGDMDMDRRGNIYFVGDSTGRVRKIDTAGIIHTIAGNGIVGFSGDGGPATDAEFYQADNVMVDIAGNIYITDRGNNRIRKINTLGIIITIAGIDTAMYGGFSGDGGPATTAEFNYLCHVAKYGGGNIYIADRNNNRIRMITDTNHAVYFTGGHHQFLNICLPATDTSTIHVSLDTLLRAFDMDTAQVEQWNLVYGPMHGIAIINYSTYSNGSIITPAGLNYSPSSGFIGNDTFKVAVTDGYTVDTTTIVVRVSNSLPVAGSISGIDSVCKKEYITLTDTVSGGIWSCSNANASVSTGIINGLHIGLDTITYKITNGCGADSVTKIIKIKDCSAGVVNLSPSHFMNIWPNPSDGIFTLYLQNDLNERMQIAITNLLGIKVKELEGQTNIVLPINLDVAAGVYFINVNTNNGTYNTKVIVAK